MQSLAKVEVAGPQGGRAGGDDAGADFPAGGDQSRWEGEIGIPGLDLRSEVPVVDADP